MFFRNLEVPMRRLSPLACIAALFASPAMSQTADRCQLVVQGPEDLVTLDEPIFSVSDVRGRLSPPDYEGQLAMVTCERPSIVPLPGDYRVLLDFGAPLTIIHADRAAVLELVDGRLNYRMLSGEVLAGDIAPIQQALNDAQSVINASGE